ncbi:hypothetical protein D3C75_882520 [compost metagenome]
MTEHVHSTFSIFFSGVVVFNITAVAGDFSQTQQTRFFGQHFVDVINAHAQRVMQVEDNRRIDVTRTGAHYQAFQWSQTHRGVYTLAVTNSRNGTAVAQVASDNIHFFHWLVQHFRGFLSHIVVAGAVCAVATNAVLSVQFVRQSIEIRFFWHGLMERGVKHSNVFISQFRERFQCFSNTDQVCRVMQRCKRSSIFDTLNHGLVDNDGAGVLLAAVNNTVADSSQLLGQFRFLCQNGINHKVQSFAVSGACT